MVLFSSASAAAAALHRPRCGNSLAVADAVSAALGKLIIDEFVKQHQLLPLQLPLMGPTNWFFSVRSPFLHPSQITPSSQFLIITWTPRPDMRVSQMQTKCQTVRSGKLDLRPRCVGVCGVVVVVVQSPFKLGMDQGWMDQCRGKGKTEVKPSRLNLNF